MIVADRHVQGLEFDPVGHVYRLNGKRIVSVTQVLDILDPFICTDGGAAAARGTTVHLACDYHDEGTLDESGVPEELLGYLRAYQRFRRECPFDVIDMEVAICHPVHLYAGRIDRVVTMGGKLTVLDLKSGSERPTHPLQVAAYAEGYKAVTGQRVRQAGCVYLRSDGTYSVRWQQGPNDLWTFLAALRVMKWRETNVR